MKRTLWQPLTVGLAALLLALPAYAENTQAPDAAAAPVAQSAPAQKKENRLAPYLGKKITKQIIKGNVAISEEKIAAALKTKQGMEFTEEGLSQDLSAIYDLGWFYDMRPEFKLVPEGVQNAEVVLRHHAPTRLDGLEQLTHDLHISLAQWALLDLACLIEWQVEEVDMVERYLVVGRSCASLTATDKSLDGQDIS